MNKVICIDDKGFGKDFACPVFGETCTVERALTSPNSGVPSYTFVEYPPENGSGIRLFHQRRFVPLSDLDETTLVNEEWEEKYCVPA
jgi:hypothetical protein